MKLRRTNYDAAVLDFNQAVRIKPDMGEGYVNRGAAAIGQHRYPEGLADLNKGIELGVDEPAKAYYNRALAYEGLDDAKAAYFDYQKAVELSPDWTAPKEQLVALQGLAQGVAWSRLRAHLMRVGGRSFRCAP